MSYLAIARKWRPMVFDEIVGQKHVTRTLQNAIRMERIHHAFLFTGPRGVGKTTVARILARALCCEQGPTPEPCGTCVLCTAILAGSAPDVIEIDGASNNSVDDVRELREGVRYLPSQARYRIYIIDEVHMLTRQAFNALLKTLEEPPPHVIFMFATTEPQKIPETIISRVQRFDFKRIPGGQVAGRLAAICEAEGVTVSEHSLRLVARAGEGSMRDAQSLLDQVISFAGLVIEDRQVTELLGLVDRGLLYKMLDGLVGGEPGRCLDAIAKVHDFGFEMDQFTAELLELLRNAALVAMAPDERRHLDLSDEEIDRLRKLASGMSPDVFARWFDALLDVHDRVARAGRPRMVLEMAVARLASIQPVQGLDRVMSRLEDLDRRLRQGGFRAAPGGARRGGPPFVKTEAEGKRSQASPDSHQDTRREVAPTPAPPLQPPEALEGRQHAGRRDSPAPPLQSPPASQRPTPVLADAVPQAPTSAPRQPATDVARSSPTHQRPPAAPKPSAPEPTAPEPSAQPPRDPALLQSRRALSPPPTVAAPAPTPATPPVGAPASAKPDSPGLPLPTVHPDDDTQARYKAVLDVLEGVDMSWTSLVEHSTALSWSGQELKVAFGSEFQLNEGKPKITGAAIRPLLERTFPGLTRVEVVLREQPQGRTETRHEARKTERARYLAQLRQDVEDDVIISRLRRDLELELDNFIPKDSRERQP